MNTAALPQTAALASAHSVPEHHAHFGKRLRAVGVVPVLTLEDVESAVEIAKALYAGGLSILEITLRTAIAFEALLAIKQALPDALVGAGTVLTPAQLDRAVECGCAFLISPGSTPVLRAHARSVLSGSAIVYMPAAATLSEMMLLREEGFYLQKLFPAEVLGGAALLKSVAPVLPDVDFNPTGGITQASARDYLSLRNVAAVGGSWMVSKEAVATKNYAQITEQARAARALRDR